jgi:hypothetical protein
MSWNLLSVLGGLNGPVIGALMHVSARPSSNSARLINYRHHVAACVSSSPCQAKEPPEHEGGPPIRFGDLIHLLFSGFKI